MEAKTVETQMGLKNLFERFYKDCRLKRMSEESIRRYRSSLMLFADFLEENGVSLPHVDKEVLKAFLGYRKDDVGSKPKTIENDFTALSAFWDFLVFGEEAKSNTIVPFRKRYLRQYKKDFDDPERRLLSVEEMSRLVNIIMDPRDKAVAVLLAKTGIRARARSL